MTRLELFVGQAVAGLAATLPHNPAPMDYELLAEKAVKAGGFAELALADYENAQSMQADLAERTKPQPGGDDINDELLRLCKLTRKFLARLGKMNTMVINLDDMLATAIERAEAKQVR